MHTGCSPYLSRISPSEKRDDGVGYEDWFYHRVYALVPVQDAVGAVIATFKERLPRPIAADVFTRRATLSRQHSPSANEPPKPGKGHSLTRYLCEHPAEKTQSSHLAPRDESLRETITATACILRSEMATLQNRHRFSNRDCQPAGRTTYNQPRRRRKPCRRPPSLHREFPWPRPDDIKPAKPSCKCCIRRI